ncbi:DUF748 domain-containing protein [Winogradskyella litoriviva]|uniref:DUF748 domain-containing protein n=1 Tax=Winogradskyella litoriviva TaxID=1220182 RepID=A0ABX2E1G9_9FLAO|nr:DUF748 domain-containing protein [Winogradskyella litoriviva]NRD21664.1 DUF748 domain-containing protein [Winogradskyella litoriviva]
MSKSSTAIKIFKKKRYLIPLFIITILIALRLYLPNYVKSKVNDILAELPGYYGEVEEVDISLIRGAYVIKGLYLNKVNAKTQVPFLNFPHTDISIEWKSLFNGRIVSEIIMNNPEVIYVMEDQQTNGETPNTDDWTKALTDIVPIDINNFEIHNGKFAFVELQANPNIDLHFNQLELIAKNLRNVSSKDRTLPSPIHATATSIGNGKMTANGNINLIKEIPDLNIEFGLENANVTSLNSFTKHYAGIDFKSGTFELFSEIAIANGYMKGYIKPLVTNSKLISKDDRFLSILWEGFVGFFKFILKNQKTDTLATKVPIEGDLNNVEAGVLPSVINIFENAWIKAFKSAVDNEIEYEDAFKEKKED